MSEKKPLKNILILKILIDDLFNKNPGAHPIVLSATPPVLILFLFFSKHKKLA